MELWTMWTHLLQAALGFLVAHFGFSEAVAIIVLGMALIPGTSTDPSMLPMLAIPVLISVIAVAALPSALGIYWATSNAVTVAQTLALRGLLARQRR